MRTLQTKGRSKNKTMVNRIGKIGLLAFLFIFVFSMVCIVLDTNVSSSIQNGTFDSLAEAADKTGTQLAAPTTISTSGTQVTSSYNVGSNPNNNTLLNNFYINSEKGSNLSVTWYSYKSWGTTYNCGFGLDRSDGGDTGYVWWLEYTFSNKIKAAIKNCGISYYASATSLFDDGADDECAIAVSYIGVHGSPNASTMISGSRSWSNASWNSNYGGLAHSGSSWSDGGTSQSVGATSYNSSYRIPDNATGIRFIFAAISDSAIAGGFRNISMFLYLNNSPSPSASVSPSGTGTVTSSKTTYANTDASMGTNSFTTAVTPYYFKNWSWTTESGSTSTSYSDSVNQYPYTSNYVANYAIIPFSFNGHNYSNYNNETLQVLENKSSYITAYDLPSGFSIYVTYNGTSSTTAPTTAGDYTATIAIKYGNTTRGTRSISFSVVKGDFGRSDNTTQWGTSSNPYRIENETHLENLSKIVNGGKTYALNSVVGCDNGSITASDVVATADGSGNVNYSGCYFTIINNIGSSGNPITFRIGTDNTHYFAGTIYGGSNSNKNIYLNIGMSGTTNVGLFGYVSGASISYITTQGSVTGGSRTGGIVGFGNSLSSISNCSNTATINGAGSIGGIAGYSEGIAISNCSNSGNVTSTGSQAAGIIGYSNASGSLSGTITNNAKITGTGMVGGIGGQYHGTFGNSATITNGASANKNHATIGNITGTEDSVGGCFGFFDKSTASVTGLINYGSVTGKTALGGIVGRVQNVVKNAKNFGNVTSTATSARSGEIPTSLYAIGGITGYTSSNIQNSFNEGNISNSNATGVGGISGTYYAGNSPVISNCYNKGTITASSNIGGIVGYWNTALNYCYNEGSISASSNYGGIVGYLADSPTLTHCYNVTTTYYKAVGSGNPSSSSKAITIFKSSVASPAAQTGGTNWYYAAYPTGIVITPIIDGSTTSAWTNIVSSNINGYTAKLTIANNHYCSLTIGSSNTQPNAQTITGYTSSVAKSSVVYSTTSFDLTLTCNYASSTPNNNILDQYKDLAVNAINPYYTTRAHNVDTFTTATTPVPNYSKEFKYFNSSNASVTDCINVGTYRVVGYPYTGNALLGISNNTSGCVIQKLPLDNIKVAFSGDYSASSPHDFITLYSDTAENTSRTSTTLTYAFPKQESTPTKPYSIYRQEANKFHFYLIDKNDGDKIIDIDLLSTGDLSIAYSGNSGSDNVLQIKITLTNASGNIGTGSKDYCYAWAKYDYSGRPASGTKVWGTDASPYIISNEYELIRLYDICTNGDASWGSIYQDAAYTDNIAKCTASSYAGGIFHITNNLNVSGYTGFRIGKDATYRFAGSIYGKSGSTDTERTITLGTNYSFTSGYRPIEYIEATGTQYINIPDVNWDYWEIDCQYTATSSEMCIVGNQDGGSTNRWEMFCDSSRPYFNIWTNAESTTAGTVSATTRAVTTYTKSTGAVTTNGVQFATKTINVRPAYLFQYGGGSYYAKARLYGFRMKYNGVLTLDMIPCVRTSDSAIGLYDAVSGTFYPNNGSGKFTAGGNSSYSVGFIGYMRASGTCYLSNLTIAGSVAGQGYTGGLVGYLYATESSSAVRFVNVKNTATITGTTYVGGIVGYSNNSLSYVEGSISNTGEISGAGSYVGGLMGAYNGYLATNVSLINGDSSNINHATIGHVLNTGAYTGGIFGYKSSRTMNVSGITVTNYGKVDGKAALGGIVGRTTQPIVGAKNYGNVTSTGGTVNANKPVYLKGTVVGGIAGMTSTTLKNCENYGTVSGAYIIGGIIGTFYYDNTDSSHPEYAEYHPTIEGCVNKANVTATATNSYVGGIAGLWRGTIKTCSNTENGSAITITGKSYVGGYVGYYLYWEGCSLQSPANIASVTGNGSYVGGIVGYNEGTITGAVSNNKLVNGNASNGKYVGGFIGGNVGGTLTGITQLTISGGVTGKNYVGGYIGASKGSEIRIGTNSTLSGTITATSGSYVGGAFGYIYASGSQTTSTARSDSGSYFRFTPSTLTASLVHAGATGSYVGGIVGYCAGISIENGENSTFTAWTRSVNLAGVYYVGGIIGYMTTFPTASEDVKIYDNAISGMASATAVAVDDTVNPGHHYSITYTESEVEYTKYFIPTIYGTVSRSGHTITITDNNAFTSGDAMTYVSTSISGWYKNTATITGTSYVGGLIGKIDTGVGNYVTTAAYARGATGSSYMIGVEAVDDVPITQDLVIKLENTGTVTGKYFVGGNIGALLNNYNSPTVIYTSNIKAVVINTANITVTNGWYAGGIIGSVGTMQDADRQDSYGSIQINGLAKFKAEDNETSFSGNKTSTANTVGGSGSYYVGGVAGFINANGDNRIAYLVCTCKVTGSYYIGGLAGTMAGGANEVNGSSIYRCVCTPHSSVTLSTSTDYYHGSAYVGGLVGDAGAITISNSYVRGFNFDYVNGDRGGVAGRSTSSTTFVDSWSLHIVNGLNYATSYRNSNGKFALVDPGYPSSLPNYDELLVTAGLATTVGTASASDNTNFKAQLGYISVMATIPSGTDKYLVFYDTTGVPETNPNRYIHKGADDTLYDGILYGGKSGEPSNNLYSKTKVSANSFILAKNDVKFVNLEYSESTANNISNDKWITAFNNGRISNEYTISITSYNYNTSTKVFTVYAIVYYNNISTGSSEDVWKVGDITKTMTSGGSDLPLSIPDKATWIEYAAKVRAGTETYYNKYLKLTNDINLGTYNSSSNNFLFGDNSSNFFRGTLDGNGKTLTYTISASNDIGLFPKLGNNATIKNLNLAGSVSGTSGVGALAGAVPSSSVTIQNIDTSVTVSGSYHVGGLIGYSSGSVTIKDAVNTGRVSESSSVSNGGVGGIIGTVASGTSISIDSVRNAGEVRGDKSLGGIIGYVDGSGEILNSCNTGLVQSNTFIVNTFTYAGGVVGQVSAAGNVSVYACYNSGKVWGYNARVGGILGCDTDNRTSSSARTNIFFCFNSGDVLSGHPSHCTDISGGNNTFSQFSGGEVGGLAGMAINADIYYSYNIGNITSYGVTSHLYESQLRAGGLVGLMYRYRDASYSSLVYCYNAGVVKARSPVDDAIYISGLVGCSIYERNGAWTLDVLKYWSGANNLHSNATVAYNYSMHGQVDLGKKNGTTGTENMTKGSKYSNNDGYFGVDRNLAFMENYRTNEAGTASDSNGYLYVDCAYYASNWTIQDTLVNSGDMICRYDSTNGVGKVPSAMESGWSNGGSYGSTVLLRTSNAIKNKSNFGYIYIPGCLPQLSIFATDTESGVAMTGQTSGYDTTTQEYSLKTAGTEFSPYVIQNGIDLLGLSQLIAIDTSYTAASKYYAFANGYNNLDGNKLTSLDMNTLNLYGMTYYSHASYRATDGSKTIALVYTYPIATSPMTNHGTQTWYSADYNDSRNVGKNIRLFRRQNNNYLDGNSTYGANYYMIGQSASKYFAGSLVGFREVVNGEDISYPEIKNLHVKNTTTYTDPNESGQSAYAAFVGYGKGCILRDFSLGTGTTISVSATAASAYGAGFIAKAMEKGTFTGLQMHSGSSVTVTKSNAGTTYAGGIVAIARPNMTSATGSNTTTIEECTSAANITTSTSSSTDAYVGGILGYAQGLSTADVAGIYINKCTVNGGTITNGSYKTSGIGTGGIVGARNTIGKLNITNCKVGIDTGATTTIIGANSIGGIISATNGSQESDLTTITNCEIGSKGTLQRNSSTNNATYSSALGGFVGYSQRCKITGENIFKGTINSSSYAANNVGGLLGYMGSYTNIQGTVHIYGTINTGTTLSNYIGGAIGYVPTGGVVNIDGNYYINPQMTTSKAKYVGGFIGYNAGTAHILGSSSIMDIQQDAYASVGNAQVADDSTIAKTSVVTANTISADTHVGGFIGYNTGTLYVGHQTDAYNTASVGTFTATLVANVNGSTYVGGFVGFNAGLITTADSKCYVVNTGNICATINGATYIGGIVGYNAEGAHFNVAVQENYFANAGQVGNSTATQANRASYAGGVVGDTLGNFTNIGTLANTGAVYGNNYVGGSIGYFPDGALAGTMINGKAKEDTYGNLVSESSKNVSGNTTTYITQVQTNGDAATATEIDLYRSVTKDANYSYTIGKTVYYFTAPISGYVVEMDFDKVAITGSITTSANSDVTTSTSNIWTLSDSTANIINLSTTYKYTLGSSEYYYPSAYYGAVYNIPTDDPDLIMIYPTLQASTTQQSGASYSTQTTGTMTKGYKSYTSGSTYYFDATNLTGTVKTLQGANVVFSTLVISAIRNAMQGTMTANLGDIITAGQNYTFLVGTTRYFFKSPVYGQITNMVGNELTISPFEKRAVQKIVQGNTVKGGHNYLYESGGNYYRFTSPVTGTVTSVSGLTATLKFIAVGERSAIPSVTANWNLGGYVKAGVRYKFKIDGSNYRYFVAPYTGDITQIYIDNGTYYVRITNTDYSDMVVDDTITSSGYTAGYVNGFNNVGGVVAIVDTDASVDFYTEGGNLVEGVYTRFINFGTVASTDGTNVGGSIGTMKGTIYDINDSTGKTLNGEQQYIEFYNYGKVYVKQNGGGSIGVFSGQGAWARMFNYSDTTIMGAELSGTITTYANLGGCIGLVQSEGGNPVILRHSIMVNSGLVSAQTNRLQVNSTNVTGECIGGVIGKITDGAVGSTKDNWSVDLYSDGSVTAGRTTNDSANYAPMNYVGGLIGYIGATPVILKSVLNYTRRSGGSGTGSGSNVTYVSGHHYVGGIVGFNNSTVPQTGTDEQKASIKYCYNVGGRVISDDYTFTDSYNTSGTCGGIVGGIGSNRPLTYCCYWISAFGNDALKNATVSQLGTSLTSEWTSHFTAYDISLLQYSPTTWADYLHIYDSFYYATHSNTLPYDYYSYNESTEEYTYVGKRGYADIILDSSNVYSAAEIAECTDWFNTHVLDIEFGQGIYEYGGTDIAPISAQAYGESAYETLKQCVATRKGFNLADLEENTDGDLGIHTGGDTRYSTGNDNTGYFFAYASDAVTGGFSQHEIQTEHTNAASTPDFDLNVWKYISQAFGASNVGQSSSQLIYNYTATDDSYNASSTPHHTSSSKAIGNTQIYHIYAKTYAPNVNGYYLYAYAVNKAGFTVSYDVYDEAIYIDADSAVCKNVLIFFKKVNLGSVKLTYNSLERYAPITGLTNVEKKDQQYTFYQLDPNAAEGFNFGTDAGTYKIDGDIYYVPNKAYIFTASTTSLSNTTAITADNAAVEAGKNYTYKVGSTDYYFTALVDGWVPTVPTSTKYEILAPIKIGSVLSGETTYTWKIHPRKIVVNNTNLTTTYDKTEKSATLVVNQIIETDATVGTYSTIASLSSNGVYPEITTTPSIANPYPAFSAVVAEGTSVTSSTGASTKDGGYCTSTVTYHLKTYTIDITAVNSGTYKIRANSLKGTKKDNYQMSAKEAQLVIEKKELTATWHTDSYTWDGTDHSITLDLTGWAVGEATNDIKTWTDSVSFTLTKETSASGSFTKSSAAVTPSGSTSTASTKSTLTFTAKAKNTYRVNWTGGNPIGTNYVMPDNEQGEMTIAALQIKQKSKTEIGTITYDGNEHTVSISLKSVDAQGADYSLSAATIKTIYDAIKAKTSYTKTGSGPSSAGVSPVVTYSTMQTSAGVFNMTVTYHLKNAGNYTCRITNIGSASDDYYMAAQTLTNQIINQKTLTITPTGTSSEYSTSSPGPETVYNNVNIGLTKVEINGFVSSDTSSHASIVNTTEVGFTHSATASGTKATYNISTKNYGTYSITLAPQASTNYTFEEVSWYWRVKSRTITATATWSQITIENVETTSSESLSATAATKNYTYSTYPQGLKLIVFSNLATGHSAQNVISTTPSEGMIASVSGNNLTVRESGQSYTGTDDAGTYTLNIGYNGSDGNYTIDFKTRWVISPVSIKAKSNITSNTEAYYNGEKHNVVISYQIGESTLSNNAYGQDTISGSNAQIISGGTATTTVCNVGVYTLTVASSIGNGGITASRGGTVDKSANYVLDTSGFSSNITYTVLPLKIHFVWSETTTFVYNGQTHKVVLDGIKLYAGEDCVTGENVVTPKTTPTDVISGYTTTTYSFVGRTANETLTIVVVSDESIDYLASGTYASVANYSSFRATGTNTANIDTIDENYEYKNNNSTTFSIYKSIIVVSQFTTLATITKTYDGTTSIDPSHLNNNPVKGNYATASFTSTNGGLNTPNYSISNPRYNDANVGTNKIINYTVSVADSNYTFSTTTQSGTNGIITARVLSVDLYLKSNKTATKQYDDTELYGTATNVNGQTTAKSAKYRLGNGFTVSNIVSSEQSGDVIITGVYREATVSRRTANTSTGEPSYNKYVNNVVYSAGEYSINKNAGYYKELVFTISGNKAGNYLIRVTTPAVVGDASSEVVVRDTRTIETPQSYELNIEITRTQIKIDNYGNTIQSYAQSNNVYTYQTEEGWLPVTAQKPARVAESLSIVVTNTWMYENGNPANGWAHITSYRRIVGGPNKSLYAYLSGPQGMNWNYELRNQPTLVIDYFVVEDTEHYQISTLAGLMLASYYHNNYATLGQETGADTAYIYTWTVICTEEQYNLNPESYQATIEANDAYFDPDAPYPSDSTKQGVWGYWAETPTEPIKYDKFRLTADISGIMTSTDYDILENAFGISPTTGKPIWGYGNTYLTNFVQTNVGNQVTVIGNIFADSFVGEFDGNGYTIKNFNVLYNVSTDAATTINIGFFGYATSTSNIYDMNLRDIAINVYDTTSYANVINVGGLIGLNDSAKALTNTTVHASISVYASGTNKIVNVGGVVGFQVGSISDPDTVATKYSLASNPYTFPTEYDVNVAIENVIAIGSITVNNAGKNNLGGIVGVMRSGESGASVFNAVTLNEIQSRAGTTLAGGIIGYVCSSYTYSAGKITAFTQNVSDLAIANEIKYVLGSGIAQYLQDSILVWTGATSSSFVNKMIGNVTITGSTSTDAGRKATGLTYTELAYNGVESSYRRSQSHYINTNSNYIYLPENTVTRGIYDVISETTQGGTAKYASYIIGTGNDYSSNNPRESLRFVDIVYTYLLRLELTTLTQQITIESTNVNVRVYKQAQSSPMLGTRRGTDHIDANSQYTDRILLAYSQHYPLLRMFRFASFELTKQINLYTNNYNIVYSGAFYGHVYSDKVQVISSNAGSYTARKVGTKTYTTLASYVAAYQKFYGLTLEEVGGYYVYKDPAKINVGIMIQGETETVFEVEKNTIPYTREELKTGG